MNLILTMYDFTLRKRGGGDLHPHKESPVHSVLINRWGEITQIFYSGDTPSSIIEQIKEQF